MHGSVFAPAQLATRRAASGMTVRELADKAGLSERNLRRLELGQRPKPWDVTLAKLAEALGCTIEDLCATRAMFHPAVLTARRAALRMTSRALAEKAGVSYRNLRRIELGHQPHPGDLVKLAAAMNCTVEDLTVPAAETAAA